MACSLAKNSRKVQLQLPERCATSGITEWLDDSIRLGYGERFAGAFREAGLERVSDLHDVDMLVLEERLKDAGAKLIQLKQIREVVDRARCCPKSSRCTPSNAGSRLGTPSTATCRSPASLIDLQSPMASFFGESCNSCRKSTSRVSFALDALPCKSPKAGISQPGSLPCKSPKTCYFDENCNAMRPCKSPMSAYFDGDGDHPSFCIDLQPPHPLTPLPVTPSPATPPEPTLSQITPVVLPLPNLLQSARLFCQASSQMQQCGFSAQDVMQQQLHQMQCLWAQAGQDAKAASMMHGTPKQGATATKPQHSSQADDSKRRHSEHKLAKSNQKPLASTQPKKGQRLSWADEVADDTTSLPVLGNVRSLSKDPSGCWRVQAYIDEAHDESHCAALAKEFQGHISEAAQCPHANHVLRKLINALRPESLQFVIDEFVADGAEAVSVAARHRYGCRIVEGLLLQCSAEQVQPVVDMLHPHIYDLCTHMYGNFVMQRVVERGTESARCQIFQTVKVHLSSMGTNFYGSALIGTCLKNADAAERLEIARALISVDGLLAAMARFKHGKLATESLVGVLSGEDLQAARYQLYQATPLKAAKSSSVTGKAAVAVQK